VNYRLGPAGGIWRRRLGKARDWGTRRRMW
jgi:hypothetical protein